MLKVVQLSKYLYIADHMDMHNKGDPANPTHYRSYGAVVCSAVLFSLVDYLMLTSPSIPGLPQAVASCATVSEDAAHSRSTMY
jgi:hypothetical protein